MDVRTGLNHQAPTPFVRLESLDGLYRCKIKDVPEPYLTSNTVMATYLASLLVPGVVSISYPEFETPEWQAVLKAIWAAPIPNPRPKSKFAGFISAGVDEAYYGQLTPTKPAVTLRVNGTMWQPEHPIDDGNYVVRVRPVRGLRPRGIEDDWMTQDEAERRKFLYGDWRTDVSDDHN